MDAVTSFYTIAVGNGMISSDVRHFHPSELLDHGGFGLGDAAVAGASATASDMAASFAANNFAATSFFATASAPPQVDHIGRRTQPEEMDEGYGFVTGAGGSCVPASLQRPDHSDAMAVWSSSSSSSKKPTGTWSSAAGDSRAVTVHEPYHHLADVAGFHYSLAAADAAGNAPASSELSLTLCSKSPSDTALNAAAADQCSSGASRGSALTELPPPPAMYPPRARHRPAPANFAVVVARSPYAAVAQEVLNDVVSYMLHGVADVAADSCSGATTSVVSSNRLMAPSSERGGERRGEAQRVKNDLLKLLQLMDDKYNQCLDEIQSTTAKFNALMHSAGGGGGGGGGVSNIYAPFAHRAVSAVYDGLRRRIAGEIMAAASRATATCWGESSSSSAAVTTTERSWESSFIKKHWAAQQRRRGEQQCWRPQRGLPEKCVAVLKAWLFDNFLHPYPKDHEKEVLAARSGLTRNQVSNWFINARVRLWKPMIEEMYQDLKKSSVVGGQGSAMEMHTSKRRIFELEEGH
ncbi:hypothetical protein HU200_050503 [Digitaria exilis]|uniref:Homeobox domain-containing protein n=1 Tax=Digitaria exilis TaxID=1010633 RepID=A0A835AT82_9POAL|nr:hypothetical protein HU200_050503 [Digitaria exilis]